MRTTLTTNPHYEPLSSRGLAVFLLLTALWIARWLFPGVGFESVHSLSWLWGYLALIFLLVPYVFVIRRAFASNPGRLSWWLRRHVDCAYVAFFFLLLHSQGRSGSYLTFLLLVLTWVVMLSGVIGFYGQKALFAWLPALSQSHQEYGRERLEPEREMILKTAEAELEKAPLDTAEGFIREYVRGLVQTYLQPEFRFLEVRVNGSIESRYEQICLLVTAKERVVVDKVWELTQRRLKLDREYRLHQLGRGWLLFHGPAAWGLLVLVIEHVVLSLRYAGLYY